MPPALDDRPNVPIAEAMRRRPADGDRVGMTANDDPGLNGVDGRTVAGGDVDAEVKRGQRAFGIQVEAGISERSPNRVWLVERLHGPAVRGGGAAHCQRKRENRKEKWETRGRHSAARYKELRGPRCRRGFDPHGSGHDGPIDAESE